MTIKREEQFHYSRAAGFILLPLQVWAIHNYWKIKVMEVQDLHS